MKFIKTNPLLLWIALFLCACGQSSSNKEEKVDTAELAINEPENDSDKIEIASFTLRARGETEKWSDTTYAEDEACESFGFSQENSKAYGSTLLHINLSKENHNNNPKKSLMLDLFTTGSLEEKNIAKSYDMMPGQQLEICQKNAGSCVAKGVGIYGKEGEEDGNELHIKEGKLIITKVQINSQQGKIITGRISGTFDFSGTNTENKNPGTVNGSFENVPFTTAALH